MSNVSFSIIIPVYNRPYEIDELLASIEKQSYDKPFEIIVVDDGSLEEKRCDFIIEKYSATLHVKYFYKPNSGAGLSRNFGMEKATENYYIILDSDVILPQNYLTSVHETLSNNYTDIYGGPDAAHPDFSTLQKAINYAMTSFWTTGGLRGGKNNKDFQPRSFNLGMSKEVYEETNGFSDRKIGEDIDFSFRVKSKGFTSQLIPEAFVYHKRRSTLSQFFNQTFAFGKERPKLSKAFPKTNKITYWFPSLFLFGLILSILLFTYGCFLPILMYGLYLAIVFLGSSITNKSISVGLASIVTTLVQFSGYGLGFIKGLLL